MKELIKKWKEIGKRAEKLSLQAATVMDNVICSAVIEENIGVRHRTCKVKIVANSEWNLEEKHNLFVIH